MAIESIVSSAQNGFYLNNAEVTISFMNHGSKTKTNIPLSYTVYKDGTESSNVAQTVTEIYTGSIEPGATVKYAFNENTSF